MTLSYYLAAYAPAVLIAWLTLVSTAVAGYLLKLQINDLRRNRRMDALREQLGLRRA